MARESKDREDLLRDATAYVSRVLLSVPSHGGPIEVFAGFHSTGAASFYFDQDPVYHFNRSCHLRRAHVDGLLIKAEAGNLVRMQRHPRDGEVALHARRLSPGAKAEFCQSVSDRLSELRTALHQNQADIVGSIASVETEDVVARLVEYLGRLDEIAVAASPHVTA